MALALASGPMALALALRAALTIFWHRCQTQGPTTTAKVELTVILLKMILRTVAVIFAFT